MMNLETMNGKELIEVAKSLGVKLLVSNDSLKESKAKAIEKIKAAQTKKNGWEKIATRNITNAYNWLVGELENSVSDGNMTEDEFSNWMINDAFDEIYSEALNTRYEEGMCGGPAPKEMRFAGKEFCQNLIKKLFKDEYGIDICSNSEMPKSNNKRGKQIEFNGKSQNLDAWAKELGIIRQTLYGRLYHQNWSVEKAFTTPGRKNKSN